MANEFNIGTKAFADAGSKSDVTEADVLAVGTRGLNLSDAGSVASNVSEQVAGGFGLNSPTTPARDEGRDRTQEKPKGPTK